MIDGPFSAPSSPPEIAAADEVDALVLQRRLAAAGVLELGVAAVDDDVARLEQLGEFVDHGVGRAAGLDHDHDLAGHLQRRNEIRRRLRRHERAVGAVLGDQRLGLAVWCGCAPP